MKYVTTLTPRDQQIAAARLSGFMPDEVFDIHVHPYKAEHFAPGTWSALAEHPLLGCRDHRAALQRYMPVKTMHGLYFGMPHKTADRPALNDWLADEVKAHGTPLSRGLMLVSPADDPAMVTRASALG